MKNINKTIEEKLSTAKNQEQKDNLIMIRENFGFLGEKLKGKVIQKITKYNRI